MLNIQTFQCNFLFSALSSNVMHPPFLPVFEFVPSVPTTFTFLISSGGIEESTALHNSFAVWFLGMAWHTNSLPGSFRMVAWTSGFRLRSGCIVVSVLQSKYNPVMFTFCGWHDFLNFFRCRFNALQSTISLRFVAVIILRSASVPFIMAAASAVDVPYRSAAATACS